MERGSDKHSPMVDDQLKHDTQSMVGGAPAEARSQEAREQEGPAEGEPTPDARLAGERGMAAGGMSLDDVNARADLARHLDRSVFPARPEALAANARARHAPDAVVALLEGLPDTLYDTIGEVWVALGEPAEGPNGGMTEGTSG